MHDCRAKLAEDEPRCEELRKENEELTQALIKCRDQQMALLEELNSVQTENTSLRAQLRAKK